MLADPGVGARHGTGRVGVMDLACSRSLSLAFVLSPRALSGLHEGRCEYCALPHPRFLTTGGAKFRRLSRSLGLERRRSMSSLTGMIEWNPGPSFVTGSA